MFKLDVSEIEAIEKRAIEELKRVPRIMKAIADVGALEERRDHEYRNRTGNLQRGTKAKIVENSSDRAVVELEMGEDYASYVVARGLSTIEEQAKIVARGIQVALDAQAARISK